MAWLALWAVIVVVAVVRLGARHQRHRRRYGSDAVRSDVGGALRKAAPYALLFGASTCLLLLFAQIRFDRNETTATVVLAIDVSDSMLATDVKPDRFTAAKAAATSFLDEVPPGFRVGVVTFAGEAATVADPDQARTATAEAIERLEPSRGTVIGDGLAEALDVIAAERTGNEELPAAVVLLSDGADTGSVVSPTQATARARDMVVPVFTVAIVGERGSGGWRHGAPAGHRDQFGSIALDRRERRRARSGVRTTRRPAHLGPRGRELGDAAAGGFGRADGPGGRDVPRHRPTQLTANASRPVQPSVSRPIARRHSSLNQ